jgi:hypothetical protein
MWNFSALQGEDPVEQRRGFEETEYKTLLVLMNFSGLPEEICAIQQCFSCVVKDSEFPGSYHVQGTVSLISSFSPRLFCCHTPYIAPNMKPQP